MSSEITMTLEPESIKTSSMMIYPRTHGIEKIHGSLFFEIGLYSQCFLTSFNIIFSMVVRNLMTSSLKPSYFLNMLSLVDALQFLLASLLLDQIMLQYSFRLASNFPGSVPVGPFVVVAVWAT